MTKTEPALAAPRTGLRRYIGPKRLALLLIYGGGAAACWYYWRQGVFTPEAVFAAIDQEPVLAPVLFILAYILSVVFLIPSLPLNLGAGVVWGPVLGSVYSLIGGVLGSMLSFVVARSALGQPLARRFDNIHLRWLTEEIEAKGWRVVAFVRLNPVFPSGPVNYLFGLTSLTLLAYSWSTAVFMYPLCLLMALLGHSAGSLLIGADTKRVIALLLVLSAVATAFVLGKRALKGFSNRS